MLFRSASSENANNALLAKRYNDNLPYKSVAQKRDKRVKNSMEFANCVVFIRENSKDVAHREFDDDNWHFYAIGNIGDSKETDDTRVNDPNDPREFVVEISENTYPNSTFPTGVFDKDNNKLYSIDKSLWKRGNAAYDELYDNWDSSFEFRYSKKDIAKNEEETNKQIFRDFYEWVITSTDAEFKSQLGNWFIVDSAIYFYLFTERFIMTDNRAKNTFYHYAKHYISNAEARELGDDAKYYIIDDEAATINNGYRFDFWDYDNDTALGINNSGSLKLPYGTEDIDYRTYDDPSSGYAYNGAEHSFFRRIRKLMGDELETIHNATKNAWDADDVIKKWDSWQAQFPEELWRIDIERKYYRTYYGGNNTFIKDMMNGRKKYQRRQFERDQFGYIATKYYDTDVKTDNLWFRCNTPASFAVTPNYDIKIVPYSDMYLTVHFGNSADKTTDYHERVKANVEYTVKCGIAPDASGKHHMDDTMFTIYYASRIQSLSDLSACYIHDSSFGNATKLQKLVFGNGNVKYNNTFLTDIGIGNNTLLKELDIRRCSNLNGSLDLTKCNSLEKLYAEGSSITGVAFAPYGRITKSYLPDTINTLDFNNLHYLNDLQASFVKLEDLKIQDSPIIDEYQIVNQSIDKLKKIYLTGIDWKVADTELIRKIYQKESSYLSGKLEISGAAGRSEIDNYRNKWKDLDINCSGHLFDQYTVTFKNYDGTTLYTEIVDSGKTPTDPITLIGEPIRDSDAQYTYKYLGWSEPFGEPIFSNTVIYAEYTPTLRSYTVTWYLNDSIGARILDSGTFNYGTEAVFGGDTPTDTSEEGSYIYKVFAGWDKSTGFIKADTNVYAKWETGTLPPTGTKLKNMTIGQICAVTRSGKTSEYFVDKDYVDITLGHDFDFANVDSDTLVSVDKPLYLDGKTSIEAKNKDNKPILLFDKDISFTIAIDFQFSEQRGVLVSCYNPDKGGFILRNNGSYPWIRWGNAQRSFGYGKKRDIVVLRHRKGEDKLFVHTSNSTSSSSTFDKEVSRTELNNGIGVVDATLTFGSDSSSTYGKGHIYWCKVWYDDLGETNAKQIASWYRETLRMEFYGKNVYDTVANSKIKTNASFICNQLLEGREYPMYLNSVSTPNIPRWDESDMRKFLNGKFYESIPIVWKTMIQKAKIKSVYGARSDWSENICTSEDYIYLPAYTEVYTYISNTATNTGTYTNSYPYIDEKSTELQTITWFNNNNDRIKFKGYKIKEDARFYTSDSDPTGDSFNDVKEGDVWVRNASYSYIYVSKENAEKYNIEGSSNINAYNKEGVWVYGDYWYLRSFSVANKNYIHEVYLWGYVGSSSGYTTSEAICPCFSI